MNLDLASPLAEAVRYVRNTLASQPRVSDYSGQVDVVNIEAVHLAEPTVTRLVLDLSDGTTIRLDVSRVVRPTRPVTVLGNPERYAAGAS